MSRNWRVEGEEQVEGRVRVSSALDLFIKFEISIDSMPTINFPTQ